MVEEMLAARGIGVTYETVRQWGRKFGKPFSDRIRQRAPARGDKWHRDEVVISIAGAKHWPGALSTRMASFSTSRFSAEETRALRSGS
ncbi:transposase-like protein [Bradyrhizobium ottawaense]